MDGLKYCNDGIMLESPNPLEWCQTYLGSIRHIKKIILKGRGFRGGSDEKMRRMWLGREIVVVGLPPILREILSFHLSKFVEANSISLQILLNINVFVCFIHHPFLFLCIQSLWRTFLIDGRDYKEIHE